MIHRWLRGFGSQFVSLILALCASVAFSAPTTAPSKQATALFEQIQQLEAPVYDRSRETDVTYIQALMQARQQYEQKRSDLIKTFFARFPDHPQAMPLMVQRWMGMAERGQQQQVMNETTPLLTRTTDPGNRAEILFVRASAMINQPKQAAAAVDAFIQAAPKDERGAKLLDDLGRREEDWEKRIGIYRRLAEMYSNTTYGPSAKAVLRQANQIGKPFELTFTDAITGREISLQKDLKGKVVVIDFWATWCGPCVAEMPKNKALYTKYKSKGVEFVGVSLDLPETGLDALKQFVAKNNIPWPQYYQGNQYQSEFSASWGITSVPAVFIVDREGNLYSAHARGELENLIPELLAKGS